VRNDRYAPDPVEQHDRAGLRGSRTVLSPAGETGSSRPAKRGSSLVIIISAHRSA